MHSVQEIRKVGSEVRAAFWQSAEGVKHAVFAGGGLEYAESQLKKGVVSIRPAPVTDEPDLSGLSCQWGPIRSANGQIVSLIVKPAEGASRSEFTEIAVKLLAAIKQSSSINPVPPQGPPVRWPGKSIALQARVPGKVSSRVARHIQATFLAAISWLVFKAGIRLGKFEPARYRREISTNTDFQKFDDGLFMTVDCAPEAIEHIQSILDGGVRDKKIRYGLHVQEQALLTCVAPSVTTSGHMHFIDGAGGVYVAAARQLK